MRRTWWSRALATVLATWFAFLVAEPFAVMHQCPMHDGAPASQATHGAHETARGDGHAHGAPAPQRHSPHTAHHQCTCVGDCGGAGTVGLASDGATLLLAADVAAARDTGLPEYEYIAAWIQYVLPFENGPPRAHRA
ncbi:MAG: hypothetical protein NVS1B4_23870 [Gemmatimonadaceae bacterium]